MSDLKKVFNDVIANKIRAFPEKARVIERARKDGRLLAIRGTRDYVEKVLPYCYASQKIMINAHTAPPDLGRFDAIFVGCPGRLAVSDWQAPLAEFLAAGGVLLTTDWSLNLIEKLFPRTIRRKGTAGGKFPLRVRTPGHPLLEGLSDAENQLWVIESMSHRISVVNPKIAEILLDAPAMGEPAALLVAFPVGKGLVVHAISHFHLQGSDASGEYISAYILTNVIDEAMPRRRPELLPQRIRVISPDNPAGPSRIRILN
jgi:hypothetical protein